MGNLSGAQTPILAGEAAAGYAVTQERAGWAELDMGVIRVGGQDHANWLHKIVTADIEHLAVGQGTHAALLDAKGHIVADFTALRMSDSIVLLAEPERAGMLQEGLRRYIIREKVILSDDSGRWGLFTLVGTSSDAAAARIFGTQAPPTGYSYIRAEFDATEILLIRSARALANSTDILVPSGARERVRRELADIPVLSRDTLEVLRIEAGIPRWGMDFDASNLVLEIPDVFSVRVDQGCYVGQEVVARLVHRGHVNRVMTGLKFEGAEPPSRSAVILEEGKEVGFVTSAAISPRFGSIGLGYVRRESSGHGTWLQVGHARAQVVKLPFEE